MSHIKTLIKTKKSILIVLGMHRSGTSVITRLFNLLGADPGDNLMLPADDNPTGFWEPVDIVAIHDELLTYLGSSWDDPRPLPHKWWERPDLKSFEDRILKLIELHYSDISIPIIKDPRLCRLLPFWQKILKSINWEVKCILIARSPLEVAESLKLRNGIAFNHSYLLWLRYVIESEAWSANSVRTFLLYSQIFGDCIGEIKRCKKELGLNSLRLSENKRTEISNFIDKELRHNNIKESKINSNSELQYFVADAFNYFSLRCRGKLKEKHTHAAFNEIENRLKVADNLFSSIWKPIIKQKDGELESSKLASDSCVAKLEAELIDLKNENVAYLSSLGAKSDQFLAELDYRREEYVASSTEYERKIDEKNVYAEKLQTELLSVKEVLSRKDGELESSKLASDSCVAKLEAELIDLKNENVACLELLNVRECEAENGRAHIQHLEKNLKQQELKYSELESKIVKIKNSFSWSITLPLRLLYKLLFTIISLLLNPFVDIFRWFYHSSLFRKSNKHKLKEFLFKYFSLFFCHTDSYKNWLNWSQSSSNNNAVSMNALRGELNGIVVSVIIPVYNHWEYTEKCLRSIKEFPSSCKLEIIVVDDCSTDETQENIKLFSNVLYVRNEENSGFIHSCNNGASQATGDYLFFLNNDVVVTEGWVDELALTFLNFPNAGLAGSKLMYPDGRLQEAGGIIWQDGSAWNYGRLDDPEKPEYNYLREVDYISGAAVMIPKALFNELEGFDTYYKPAYCEDSDLALKIRNKGMSVLYQPLSVVVHFEGISSGTDVNSGVKSYQVKNTKKLFNRWRDNLSTHRPNGIDPYLERDRKSDLRILVVDTSTPEPDKDAGSVTAFFFMQIMAMDGHRVTFIPADNFVYLGGYTKDLQRIGVECVYAPYCCSVDEYLQEHGKHLDVVFLYRVSNASKYIDQVRIFCPNAKIVFNTVDLHYLREERQAEIEGSKKLLSQAKKTKKLELEVINKSDSTIVLSDIERDLLLTEVSGVNIHKIPLILDIPGRSQGFEDRKGLLFIGGFRHTPNIDAVIYFTSEIWPLIKAKQPDIKFTIIGSHPPKEVLDLDGNGINIVGFVSDISEYFNNALISVAPLRYGAGIKGKIGTSLSYGVPVVGTTIATEGMGIENDVHVLIGDNPNEFANKIIELLKSEAKWNNLSESGLEFIEDNYSISIGRKYLRHFLDELRTDSDG
jgi:GT2 family glycosyltransferase